MKITRLKIKSSLTALGLFFFTLSFGQGYFLPVEVLPQKASQWCWAASIKMVIEFHEGQGNGLSQCKLAEMRYRINTGNSVDVNDFIDLCCDDIEDCNYIGFSGLKCNRTARYSSRWNGNIIDTNPSYFDLIFSLNGFNSVEDVVTEWMDWDNIKREIDACRPFIALLRKAKTTTKYNHAVVVKGYHLGNMDREWVITNDPENYGGCNGEEILLPSSIFSDGVYSSQDNYSQNNTFNYYSSLAMVRLIYPKKEYQCKPCEKLVPSKKSPIVELLELVENDLKTIVNNPIGEKSSKNKIKIKENFYSNRLTISDSSGENLESLKVMVLKKGKQKVAITLEPQKKEKWGIRKISNAANKPYKEKIKVPLPNSSKLKKLCADKNEIEIVNYLPDFYKFYRYKYKGATYLTPIRDYNKILKKGKAFSEKTILTFIAENEKNK